MHFEGNAKESSRFASRCKYVVSRSCDIRVLATPTALLVGSGLAAKYGMLARGSGEIFIRKTDLI
jgi:hypothetical protein